MKDIETLKSQCKNHSRTGEKQRSETFILNLKKKIFYHPRKVLNNAKKKKKTKKDKTRTVAWFRSLIFLVNIALKYWLDAASTARWALMVRPSTMIATSQSSSRCQRSLSRDNTLPACCGWRKVWISPPSSSTSSSIPWLERTVSPARPWTKQCWWCLDPSNVIVREIVIKESRI